MCARLVTPAFCVRRVSLGHPFNKCLRSNLKPFSVAHWGSGSSQRKLSGSKPPANLDLSDRVWNWIPPEAGISKPSAVCEFLYRHEMRIHVNTRHLFSETGHVYRGTITDGNSVTCIAFFVSAFFCSFQFDRHKFNHSHVQHLLYRATVNILFQAAEAQRNYYATCWSCRVWGKHYQLVCNDGVSFCIPFRCERVWVAAVPKRSWVCRPGCQLHLLVSS